MMVRDAYDKLTWLLLAVVVTALVALLALNRGGEAGKGAGLGKALEREMAYRARVELLGKLYGPVEALRRSGNNAAALLKLDELLRSYPGEAHGYILQGEILHAMGASDEALAAFVKGVKLNGDYLDATSPLSRRDEIQRLVDEGEASVGARAAANPGNRTAAAALQRINYLKSRLAGGCE